MAVYDKDVKMFFTRNPHASVRECGREIKKDSSRVSEAMFRMGIHSDHSTFDKKSKDIYKWLLLHQNKEPELFFGEMSEHFNVTRKTCKTWVLRLRRFHFDFSIGGELTHAQNGQLKKHFDRFAKYAHHRGVMDKDELVKSELMHQEYHDPKIDSIYIPTAYLPFSPDMIMHDELTEI